MLTKINEIRKYLNTLFVERENHISGIIASIIAGENALLLGGAGVAKSALINELASTIGNMNYFQWLLTRYTVPEELFGALSLKELELGIYKRNTAGKLPEANIGFIDEVFKANSAILNTLLTIINEKVFHNNGTPIPCPLISLFGASNEYPEENEGLEPLYDRFVCRFWVDEVTDGGFTQVLNNSIKVAPASRPSIPLKEVMDLQEASRRIMIPADVVETITKIRVELRDNSINPSTRRFVKSLKLVQANALLDGATSAANVTHVGILKDILWDREEQAKTVASIVQKYCVDTFTQRLQEFISMAEEIHGNAIKDGSTEAGTEANKKIKSITNDLLELKKDNPSKAAAIEVAENKIKAINKEILSKCLGI